MDQNNVVGVKPGHLTVHESDVSEHKFYLLDSSSTSKRQTLDGFPEKTWNTNQVTDWLHTTRFGAPYIQTFVDQKVDGEKLATLDECVLENEYGVSNKLHRLRFKRVVDQLSDISNRELDIVERSPTPKRQKLDGSPRKTWNAKRVADWLDTTQFGAHYFQKFLDMEVDGAKLATLNGHALENEYGVSNKLHRWRFKRVVDQIRLETRHDLQRSLYGDVLYHVLRYLDVGELSSIMAVSKTMSKHAKKARKNTEYLLVKSPSNCELYLETVSTICTRVKVMIFMEGSTLSQEQKKALAKSYADSLVGISIMCECSSGEATNFFACGNTFLAFLARTVKNLKIVAYKGCLREEDFLEFVRRTSLEELVVCTANPRGVIVSLSIKRLGLLLQQSRLQRHWKLSCIPKFVGFEELLRQGQEIPRLYLQLGVDYLDV